MNFGEFKWYNILIIILLIIVTVWVILLPNDASKSCVCPLAPQREQFDTVHKPIDLVQPPPPKLDNEPKSELILFYATWCGHSRSFLPEWSKFEQWAKANLTKVKVSSVRCEDGNEATCTQKGVRGYPTVILYLTNGAEHKYEGERTMDGLKKFIDQYVK
jgi:thiol-disulfide isomerase/thioredoxin